MLYIHSKLVPFITILYLTYGSLLWINVSTFHTISFSQYNKGKESEEKRVRIKLT
jgi:hypothetical protein